MNKLQVVTWLPIAVSIAMFVLAALTLRRNSSQDTAADATERATLAADVRYIRSGVDEIKVENRAIRKDVEDLRTKVASIEASASNAHKRIDDLMKG